MKPFAPPGHRLRSGLLLGSLLFATGCVSYDEKGVLNADGSGQVRIAIGVDKDYGDHQDVGEVKRKVAKLPGLRWVSTVDSNAGSRRWQGAVIAFDSVEALRPLNRIIELEDLFVGIDRVVTDSGIVLRRRIRLPPGSERDGDVNRVSWTFPGEVVQIDRIGRVDSTDEGKVRWRLPLGDESEAQAALLVRYREPVLAAPAWMGTPSVGGWFEFPRLRAWWDSPAVRAWTDALPFRDWMAKLPAGRSEGVSPWLVLLQVLLLTTVGLLAARIRGLKKRLLVEVRERNRAASGFLPTRTSGTATGRSRRR